MPGEFIDTNIVIYSLSQDDKKQDNALALLACSARPLKVWVDRAIFIHESF
jgi:predicted nucleic acid-binding protein